MKEDKSSPTGFRELLKLCGRYPSLLAMIFAFGFCAAVVMAPGPYLGKIIIDELIFRNVSMPASEVSCWLGISNTIWMLGGIVALGVSLKLLGSVIQGWQSHYILQITRNTLHESRLGMSLRMMGAPQTVFESMEPGKIASRMTNDANAVDGAIFFILRQFISSLFLVLIIVGFMLFINVWLTLIVLITMPATAILSFYAFRRLRAFSGEESDRMAALNSAVSETFGAIKLVRVFTAEPFFLRRIQERCEAIRYQGIHHWTVFHTINQLLALLSGLGADIFLFVGGILAIDGRITFGEFFAFFGYQNMLWGPIGTLLNGGTSIQIGAASVQKVRSILEVPQEKYLEKHNLETSPDFRGELRCENLGFYYHEGEPILKEVNFDIKPGTMTALVGQSGSGKTTLANLIMGLYLPTEGKLLVDGIDIRSWDLRALRSQVGVVMQDSVLFNDTVRANLTMGREGLSDESLWGALRAAHLDEVIRQMPEGLETFVGMGGTRLSGGQKQRLAIARVFVKDPKLLILDEATSALDSETEKAIQRSFDALMAGRTAVVIAHRLSTIYGADQIVVMHQGRLVEVGTHEELVSKPAGHYRDLFEAQMEGMIPVSGATRKPWAQNKA